MTAPTYAKAGGPPRNWRYLEVIDLKTGAKVEGVIEADTAAGWIKRRYRDSTGRWARNGSGELVTITQIGRFALRERRRGHWLSEMSGATVDARGAMTAAQFEAHLADIKRMHDLVDGLPLAARGDPRRMKAGEHPLQRKARLFAHWVLRRVKQLQVLIQGCSLEAVQGRQRVFASQDLFGDSGQGQLRYGGDLDGLVLLKSHQGGDDVGVIHQFSSVVCLAIHDRGASPGGGSNRLQDGPAPCRCGCVSAGELRRAIDKAQRDAVASAVYAVTSARRFGRDIL